GGGGQSVGLGEVRWVGRCGVGAVGDCVALLRDLSQRDLALTLAREILPGRHAENPRQAGRDPGDQDRIAIVRGAAYRADDGEGANQAVLSSEDGFAYVPKDAGPATLRVQPSPHAWAVAVFGSQLRTGLPGQQCLRPLVHPWI